MSQRYFALSDDVYVPGRWHIDTPVDETGQEVDPWLPLVHVKTASIFVELTPNDVQLIPVEVDGQPEEYCILVATRTLLCIDDQASEEFRYWKPEDGRPDKAGQYRAVYGMRIDPTKVGDAKVFRTWGWTGARRVRAPNKSQVQGCFWFIPSRAMRPWACCTRGVYYLSGIHQLSLLP